MSNKELKLGKKIESEHKGSIKKIKKNPSIPYKKAYEEIAKDHLKEDPKYYSKLQKYVEGYSLFIEKTEKIDVKYFAQKINDFIEDYQTKIDLLTSKKSINKYKIDRVDLLSIKSLLTPIKRSVHQKESIAVKTLDAYKTAVNANEKIKNLFNNFSKQISGKSIEEVEQLTIQLSKELIFILKSWNAEKFRRDLLGHLTQPARMVLLKELKERHNIDIPVTFTGIFNNPEVKNQVIKNRLNPEYPISVLMNIIALQSLNDVVSKADPKIKELLSEQLFKAINYTSGIENAIITYINTSDISQRLNSLDFNSLIKNKNFKKIDKPDQLEVNPDTTYGEINKDKQSLVSRISSDDIEFKEKFNLNKWSKEQEIIVEKSFKDFLIDFPSDISIFFKEWFGWVSKAALMGGTVILIAKIIAAALRMIAKFLDKNVEEKQKILDGVLNQIYTKSQAERIKQISYKIDNELEISNEELNEAVDAYEKIKDEIANKLENNYKLGSKEKIAKALNLASNAIDSKIGLISSLMGGLYLYNKLTEKPEYGSQVSPEPTKMEIDKMRNKILGLPEPQFT